MTQVQDVLKAIASYINQDPSLPTGTDLTMWISLIDQSQNEWKNAYIWRKVLTRTHNPTVGSGQTSIALPVTFERLLSPVFDYSTGINSPTRYFEIDPKERFLHVSTDKYVTTGGDNAAGKWININPALSSGASICMDFYASPSSLVSLYDSVTCQDPQFLVLRTVAKILSSRSDPRFPSVMQDSNTVLGSMIDNEAARTGGVNNQTRSSLEWLGFRPGET